MHKFYKISFLMMTILGSLITMSSYTWLGMWMGLEINLLSIIPLLSKINMTSPSEASLKYFITQVLASMILLFSIILMMSSENPKTIINNWLSITYSALFMKLGMIPFHAWLPEVIEGLSWTNSIIILTWQKIAPFTILNNFIEHCLMIQIIVISSSMISGIMGINQTSLRKMMAYSSINHTTWMTASMLSSKSIWPMYFVIYAFIIMNTIFMFKIFNLCYLKETFSLMEKTKITSLILFLNLFSLGGLLPFLGFLPKWITIFVLIKTNMLLSITLLITTLIPLYFYIRICITNLIMTPWYTNTSPQPKIKSSLITFSLLNFSGLTLAIMALNQLKDLSYTNY